MAVAVGAPTPDPRAIDPALVRAEQDPEHQLVLTNDYVRVLELRRSPGLGSSSHQHPHDTVTITIPAERLDPRSAVFAGAAIFAAGGNSQAAANPGTSEQHVIEVEILAIAGEAARAVTGEPDHVLEIENGRVRIYRVRLEPGDSIPVHTHASAWLGVTIAGPQPGAFRWHEAGDADPLTAGQYPLEMVEVEPR
jgi:hypothetical protein